MAKILSVLTNMGDKPSQWPSPIDYRAAIAKAVEWLGERYLLAEPIKALPASDRTRVPVNSHARDRHPIGSRLPLRKAAEVHAAVAKGGTGKILLQP
jgi:hypothetical protein